MCEQVSDDTFKELLPNYKNELGVFTTVVVCCIVAALNLNVVHLRTRAKKAKTAQLKDYTLTHTHTTQTYTNTRTKKP